MNTTVVSLITVLCLVSMRSVAAEGKLKLGFYDEPSGNEFPIQPEVQSLTQDQFLATLRTDVVRQLAREPISALPLSRFSIVRLDLMQMAITKFPGYSGFNVRTLLNGIVARTGQIKYKDYPGTIEFDDLLEHTVYNPRLFHPRKGVKIKFPLAADFDSEYVPKFGMNPEVDAIERYTEKTLQGLPAFMQVYAVGEFFRDVFARGIPSEAMELYLVRGELAEPMPGPENIRLIESLAPLTGTKDFSFAAFAEKLNRLASPEEQTELFNEVFYRTRGEGILTLDANIVLVEGIRRLTHFEIPEVHALTLKEAAKLSSDVGVENYLLQASFSVDRTYSCLAVARENHEAFWSVMGANLAHITQTLTQVGAAIGNLQTTESKIKEVEAQIRGHQKELSEIQSSENSTAGYRHSRTKGLMAAPTVAIPPATTPHPDGSTKP